MKKLFLVIPIVLLLVLSIGCATESSAPAVSPFATTVSVDQKDAVIAASVVTEAKTRADADTALTKSVTDLTAKVGTNTNEYTKAEVDALFAKFKTDNVDPVSTKLNQWTQGNLPNQNQQPQQQNPLSYPTGQVSYTILNPASLNMYQFATANTMSLRIFNNKSDSRYVRPQIMVTPWQNVPTLTTGNTATVLSNSQGQPPVIFGTAGTGMAIPSAAAATQIIYYATSGGVSNGQYLLTPGQQMDILVTIQITGGTVWNLSFTGTDVSLTGY